MITKQIRGTEISWANSSLILEEGQLAYETTNGILKMGNGINLFKDLLPVNDSEHCKCINILDNNGKIKEIYIPDNFCNDKFGDLLDRLDNIGNIIKELEPPEDEEVMWPAQEKILVGAERLFVIKDDNTLLSCGQNLLGSLGQGNANIVNTLTPVFSGDDIKKVILGWGSLFVIKNTGNFNLWCCGNNSPTGSLGMGTSSSYTTLAQNYSVTNVKEVIQSPASNTFNVQILCEDNTLWTSGVGNGHVSGRGLSQVNIDDIKKVVYAERNLFILKNDGTVWVSGDYTNNSGNPSTIKQITNLVDIKNIYAGQYHLIAFKNDGTVWAVSKYSNIYGNSNGIQVNGATDVKKLYYGGNQTLIIEKFDGSMHGMGLNNNGQLGLGNATNLSSMVPLNFTKNDIKKLWLFYNNLYILKNDDTLWGCGNNTDGQLGLGTTATTVSTLTKITTNATDIKELYMDRISLYALKNDDTLWGCGNNANGQLGLGHATTPITTLTKIVDLKTL